MLREDRPIEVNAAAIGEDTMPAQQPPPLNYERPGDSPRPLPSSFLWIGLAIGTAVSAATWILGWNTLVEHESWSALFFVPAVKVILAVILIRFTSLRRGAGRAFGIGLLLSIGVGLLIFFGACFAHL